MTSHGEWEECKQHSTQSALPQHMLTVGSENQALGVPITQLMANLLNTILQHQDNLKELTANRVLRFWPDHFQQFVNFVTKMSDQDRD